MLVALIRSLEYLHLMFRALPAYAVIALTARNPIASVNPLHQHLAGSVRTNPDVVLLHVLLQ